MASDPTYDRDRINANPVWELAFVLSEMQNDNAPLGWGRYIWVAESLMKRYDIALRSAPPAPEAKCPACEGNGFTLETVNECCGHGTPSGECCGDPVEGQEQVGCERCQTTGKVATPPAPEATDGN